MRPLSFNSGRSVNTRNGKIGFYKASMRPLSFNSGRLGLPEFGTYPAAALQ